MLRDFSDENKQRLLKLVKEVENENQPALLDWLGDRWYDFEDILSQLGIRQNITNMDVYHKRVIDQNNASAKTIDNIFNNVKNVDIDYAQRFKNYEQLLSDYLKYIDTMRDLISPANGNFNVAKIKSSMSAADKAIWASTIGLYMSEYTVAVPKWVDLLGIVPGFITGAISIVQAGIDGILGLLKLIKPKPPVIEVKKPPKEKKPPEPVIKTPPDSVSLQVPSYGQTVNYSCGAASGTMVLNYLGVNISEQDFMNKAETNPEDGTYVYKLKNTLNDQLGGNRYEYQLIGDQNVDDYYSILKNSLDSNAPAIVHIATSPQSSFGYETGGHYVVVTGVYKDANGVCRVKINDPYSPLWGSNQSGQQIDITLQELLDCNKAGNSYIIKGV